MDEKTMLNDVLNETKAELKTYQDVITETDNMQLRSAIQQIRNNCESFQYELYKVAQSKGYYIPAQQATQQEITQTKNQLQQ